MKIPKVSVIVPGYNEEKNIQKVLLQLSSCSSIDEIICVNDGSTDNTIDVIKQVPNIQCIDLKKNSGKAYAIAKGIEKAKGDIVLFLDADMIGFTDAIIQKLIKPLLSKKYSGVLGYPNNYRFDIVFRPLTGQRAYFKKDLLPHLSELKHKKYGLELYLNYLYKDKHIKIFALPKTLKHQLKHEKQPYDQAIKLYFKEAIDLLSEVTMRDNPISYFRNSFLYPFYFKKSHVTTNQLIKLKNLFKRISDQI